MAKRVVKSEALHIRISVELKRAIEREAARLRVKPSDLVRMTLAERCADRIEFVRAIIEFVNKYMNFGEAACPFCGHYHNHDANCLYLKALGLGVEA
ncbi:MAG: hypothetical protein KAJ19_27585 [Gammaproteobacteria bacterium]|nr:hypothetical protein [Gammaproteobacteria bacterium]